MDKHKVMLAYNASFEQESPLSNSVEDLDKDDSNMNFEKPFDSKLKSGSANENS